MVSLENSCETLTYGAPKPSEKIKEVIALFNEAEKLIQVMLDEKA